MTRLVPSVPDYHTFRTSTFTWTYSSILVRPGAPGWWGSLEPQFALSVDVLWVEGIKAREAGQSRWYKSAGEALSGEAGPK